MSRLVLYPNLNVDLILFIDLICYFLKIVFLADILELNENK